MRERIKQWLAEHPTVLSVTFLILAASGKVLDDVQRGGADVFRGP